MESSASDYPLTFNVEYPERGLNRLSTAFRIIVIIPIAILLSLVNGSVLRWDANDWAVALSAGGLLFVPVLLMILFQRKYPRWWFDWNKALAAFGTRVLCYLALLRDEYPSTDEEQAVHLDFAYPDVKAELNQWLPLVKWFLAIPHYFLLFFLVIAAFVVVIISWFAILFTGRYPKGFFDFVVGVIRWGWRVSAYAFLLITDRYPPFTLREQAI